MFKSRLAFSIGIHVTLLAGVSPAKRQREASRIGIPTEKARRDLNASDDMCFYLFQMAKTICQLVAWSKDTRVTQKSMGVAHALRTLRTVSVQVSKHSKTCTECPYKLTGLLKKEKVYDLEKNSKINPKVLLSDKQ